MIERSGDGKSFEEIGRVEGFGNSLELQKYAFYDDAPISDANYYRLAQYDFDGRLSYSDIRILEFQRYIPGTAIVKLYPNPVVDFAFIDAIGLVGDISLFIFDSRGALIKQDIIKPGTQFDLSDLSAGQYVLKMYDQHRYLIGTEKIIIVNE